MLIYVVIRHRRALLPEPGDSYVMTHIVCMCERGGADWDSKEKKAKFAMEQMQWQNERHLMWGKKRKILEVSNCHVKEIETV